MIKLADIESVEEEVTFGTCELCFSVMDYTFEYFIFEDSKTGERHSILNGEWDWDEVTCGYIIVTTKEEKLEEIRKQYEKNIDEVTRLFEGE